MRTPDDHIVFAPPRDDSTDYRRPTSRGDCIGQLAKPVRAIGTVAALASIVVDLGVVCAFWVVGKALDKAADGAPSVAWTTLAVALAVVIVASHMWAGNRNENAVTVPFTACGDTATSSSPNTS